MNIQFEILILALLASIITLSISASVQAEGKCDEDPKAGCSPQWSHHDDGRAICGDSRRCSSLPDDDAWNSIIYEYGGTAQAYKPNVKLTKASEGRNVTATICDPSMYGKQGTKRRRHRVATWPYSRWTRSASPPILKCRLQIWFCEQSNDDHNNIKSSGNDCCCRPIHNLPNQEKGNIVVEAWQARPDGSYSSIRPSNGKDDDDCRARIVLDTTTSAGEHAKAANRIISLETVAPGSVGSLGGLVPWPSLDWMPYRPPLLHLLISSPKLAQASVLFDLPLLIDPKTLMQQEFSSSSSWRGPQSLNDMIPSAKNQASPIKISSWIPNLKDNTIDVSLDVFLERKTTCAAADDCAGEMDDDKAKLFCNSLPFGFPASFLLEPISICSPTVLDFFDL
ncbi:hypothetical protein ACA910_001826 [Epithemia clementina (nom. ined.)]